MIALRLNYRAHDGTVTPVHIARDVEGVFVYADIARALMTKAADRTSPVCDSMYVRRVTFENLKSERKCVTLAGLFTCTPTSRTDNGREDASGPAIHFHGWLRAVVLPALESDDWPPSHLTLDTLQRGWLESERDKLTQAIQEIGADEIAPVKATSQRKASKPTTALPVVAPEPERKTVKQFHNTFPASNGFAIGDNMDDFLSVGRRH